MQPRLKYLDSELAENAVCYKHSVVTESPVRDVKIGKRHHLQLEDSLYVLFILGNNVKARKTEKFWEEEPISDEKYRIGDLFFL